MRTSSRIYTRSFGGQFQANAFGSPAKRDGYVYMNGELLDEPYIKDDRAAWSRTPSRRSRITPHFVMADNRLVSCDLALWAPCPNRTVVEIKPG